MKSNLFLTLCLSCLLILSVSSCKKDTQAPAVKETHNPNRLKSASVTAPTCGTPTSVTLFAGQTINVGTVTVSNSDAFVTVTYTTTGGWYLTDLHLYVGDCALIPVNGAGNPIPGHFPYTYTPTSAIQQYTFTIPVSSLGQCNCIAAHAVVQNIHGGTETAWGAGTRITSKGNWATKFSYCNQTCNTTCILAANVLFSGEVQWPNGGTPIIVGGYTYTTSTVSSILYSSSNDARTALLLIAALKIYGNTVSPPASIVSDATIVENWLSTLGQLTDTSQFTAPSNVLTSINNLQAWETSHTCN